MSKTLAYSEYAMSTPSLWDVTFSNCVENNFCQEISRTQLSGRAHASDVWGTSNRKEYFSYLQCWAVRPRAGDCPGPALPRCRSEPPGGASGPPGQRLWGPSPAGGRCRGPAGWSPPWPTSTARWKHHCEIEVFHNNSHGVEERGQKKSCSLRTTMENHVAIIRSNHIFHSCP